MASLQVLLRISRPRFWLYLAGPFLIGATVAAPSLSALLSPLAIALFFLFLIPGNVLLYGVNDIADKDTDKFNKKKRTHEHLLRPSEEQFVSAGVFTCGALLLLVAGYLLVIGYASVAAILALFLFLSVSYSLEPLRWKRRPVVDSLSNVLYVLPGFIGFGLFAPVQLIPWPLVFALWAWTAAMHLYSAIPDRDADKRAGLRTSALLFGERGSLWVCAILWASFSFILLQAGFGLVAYASVVYVLLPILPLLKIIAIEKLYWLFPYITAVYGAVVWWTIALSKFLA